MIDSFKAVVSERLTPTPMGIYGQHNLESTGCVKASDDMKLEGVWKEEGRSRRI